MRLFETLADELRLKGIRLQEEGPGVLEEVVEVSQISVSDPVRLYLNEMGRYPLLTAQQEVELAMQMESGRRAFDRIDVEEPLSGEDRTFLDHEIEMGEIAHRKLVQSNLRLVVALARRYVGPGDGAVGSDSGGKRRVDAGGGAFRLSARLQVLNLRNMVDTSGHLEGHC